MMLKWRHETETDITNVGQINYIAIILYRCWILFHVHNYRKPWLLSTYSLHGLKPYLKSTCAK